MIKVYVKKQGSYPISSPKLKKTLADFFASQGIVSESDVHILIVNKNEMMDLGRKYLSKKDSVHNVLSFVTAEAKQPFVEPPDKILHLGDIAVCYPIAAADASIEGILVEEKVIELLIHGAYHLLGKHHE
ncbi:MAG: putative rRNA maturation factor [Candidatus Woesebacteria bacterium GW2011_GWA1_39_21]|uniref:Putative rRNA maturation factor n=1 Tax=Candidatus Woesebacteria bacterium GW2011_GWA1_39_21 TaxID=1618550 RepID=A0A0G0RA18_9BACT|nr:MAG: putative rRNA maturation factor [Candidatus Woesebacteria bacterium GW2011_GWA1_39_21]